MWHCASLLLGWFAPATKIPVRRPAESVSTSFVTHVSIAPCTRWQGVRPVLLKTNLEGPRLGQSWERHPGETLAVMVPNEPGLWTAVRSRHNGRVTEQDILHPHQEGALRH